jgi:hypothetical protein
MIEKYISPFIQSQFPVFYKEYGPNFIAFVRAYYEWMESTGGPLGYSRLMYSYADIDNTLDTFIQHFKNKYMLSIPESVVVDKRLLTKHILDLYKSKGSLRAYELLFRILFNEDIQVYVPGNDVFKLSDNQYIIPKYIEVTDNKYLNYLVGRTIVDSTNSATAIVENYSTKVVNNRTINVLTLSSVFGDFNYGQRIFCSDLYVDSAGNTIGTYEYNKLTPTQQSSYGLALTTNTAPFIIGSLSSIGIENGGSGFNIGELLGVSGDGLGGIARVSSVRNESGKVSFTLLDGGSGYSLNAVVQVVGGGGSGATFKVGGLADKEVFRINTDLIQDSYNTQLETTGAGCNLAITGVSGTFHLGDNVYSASGTNTRPVDVILTIDRNMANGESLSNSSLGISSVVAYRVDGNMLHISGSGITNANLQPGTILASNTSNTIVTVSSLYPVQNTYGNGTVSFVNSSIITITGDFGYFVPSYGIVSANGGATATVTAITRNTDWTQFPASTLNKKNLDQQIGLSLTTYDLEVGTITYLSEINPGNGYSSNPTVSITEQKIFDLQIQSKSGFKGGNAIVAAQAGTATGVVTTVDIYDSGFGYIPDTYVTLSSSNTQNQTVVSGRTVVNTQGSGSGYFKNRSGFLSDTQHIIDSMYWQSLSYDIIASRMMSTYETFVRDLVHPAGIALYGTFRVLSEVQNEPASAQSFSLAAS